MSASYDLNAVRTAYKLTTQDGFTRKGEVNETKWGPGVTHKAPGNGPLCSEAWIHCCDHAALALFLDPVQGKYGHTARLWRCEWSGTTVDDWGLKRGASCLTTIEPISMIWPSVEQCVRFAIRCAWPIYYTFPQWGKWARNWLSGVDRGRQKAPPRTWVAVAVMAADGVTGAVPWSAAEAAAEAAEAAAWSAEEWSAEEWSAEAAAQSAAEWQAEMRRSQMGTAPPNEEKNDSRYFDLGTFARWAMTDDVHVPEPSEGMP